MRPLLLCLNLRRDHISAATSETIAALSQAAALMRRARRHRWSLLHVYTRGDASMDAAAFGGLEPLIDEPVFEIATVSAFDEPQIAEAVKAVRPRPIILAGGVYSRAGLAFALAAQNHGIEIHLAHEACLETHFEAVEADRVRELARLEIGSAGGAARGEVICLSAWRK